MKGDYYRYIGEYKKGDEDIKTNALKAYESATQMAE